MTDLIKTEVVWWQNHDDLMTVARALTENETLGSRGSVLDFFEKPWKWDPEAQVILGRVSDE